MAALGWLLNLDFAASSALGADQIVAVQAVIVDNTVYLSGTIQSVSYTKGTMQATAYLPAHISGLNIHNKGTIQSVSYTVGDMDISEITS